MLQLCSRLLYSDTRCQCALPSLLALVYAAHALNGRQWVSDHAELLLLHTLR